MCGDSSTTKSIDISHYLRSRIGNSFKESLSIAFLYLTAIVGVIILYKPLNVVG